MLPKAPALAGLMRAESANASVLGQIEVAPPGGDVEVKVVLMADPTVADEALYRLEVAVSYLKE